MNDYEKQFEQIVAGLNIDDRPNAEHKKKLRQRMLAASKNTTPDKTAQRIQPIWSRIMKSNITKSAAAAIIVATSLFFLNITNSNLYAQVITAMEKARTIHAIGYNLQDGKLVKTNEIWYKRDSGFKILWKQHGHKNILIDNGRFCWKYQQGQNFAGKSKSLSTERLPKEITETYRYLEKCTKAQTEVINGVPCQLYSDSYPTKPDSTRLMYWVDENLWPRRFEEKVLENNEWKTIELVEIEYNLELNSAIFEPTFGTDVEIIDETKILEDNFTLENAIFTKEEMNLIFAVHEIKRCQNDLIFTVTSLRPNQKLDGKYASKGSTAWNYGDYQFGTSFERFGPNKHHSYSPIELAWFYRDGLLIRWIVFIPRGFESQQVDKIKLELYYLYASGSWAAKRKADGLEDRMHINPIAVLLLPEDKVNLEDQLNQTYNLIKLLEPMQAEEHLVLKSVPFTDEEMNTFIKDNPNDGIAKMWEKGNKSSRLSHSQSKKPSQISFEDWLEDRMEEIEKNQNQ